MDLRLPEGQENAFITDLTSTVGTDLADIQARGARHERVRSPGRRCLPHLPYVRARGGRSLGHVPVARSCATRSQRNWLVVASPRRVRPPVNGGSLTRRPRAEGSKTFRLGL